MDWSGRSQQEAFRSLESHFLEVQCLHLPQVLKCRVGKALRAFYFPAIRMLLALNININSLRAIVLFIFLEEKKARQSCSFFLLFDPSVACH